MHTYLRSTYGDLEAPTDSVIYGTSTDNKIERWWKELLERMVMYFNPISAGGPPPSRFIPRHRHKYKPIDFKCSDFQLLLPRHNLTKSKVPNLSGGHVITLLSEALCFTTYLSLYLHRIFMFYFSFFLTFILSVN